MRWIMSRLSADEYVNGHLKNGYDYDLQMWVLNYIVQDCGHLMPCHCNGRKYKGKDIREVKK